MVWFLRAATVLSVAFFPSASARGQPVQVLYEDFKLTAGDSAFGDSLGLSVSISGETAVVGAPTDDSPRFNAGSAYVFVRSGTRWIEQAKLTSSDAAAGDAFGRVSISGDTVVIGAPNDDDAGDQSGSAYVYVRSETGWIEQAKLTAPDGQPGDVFGLAVAVSGDMVAVGSPFDDVPFVDNGSVYVFVRSGTVWNLDAKLMASDGFFDLYLGASVSISGQTLLVGAYGDDTTAPSSGAAYVFVRDETGWLEQAKLTGSDITTPAQFGRSVSVSGDTAVVGASNGGAGYVFVRDGSIWTEQAKLLPVPLSVKSVAVSGDTVVVGVPKADGADIQTGSAYRYVREGTDWIVQAELTSSDGGFTDIFGWSVAVSGDTTVAGAPQHGEENSGAAYVFEPGVVPPDVPAVSPWGLLALTLLLAVGSIVGWKRSRRAVSPARGASLIRSSQSHAASR